MREKAELLQGIAELKAKIAFALLNRVEFHAREIDQMQSDMARLFQIKLDNAAAEMGDPWAAVNYRLRVLERDPYDEDAHLGLVSTLSAAGRHGEARRFYRAYVARMEELGVEPAPFPSPAS